jgi:hypothetical protein
MNERHAIAITHLKEELLDEDGKAETKTTDDGNKTRQSVLSKAASGKRMTDGQTRAPKCEYRQAMQSIDLILIEHVR